MNIHLLILTSTYPVYRNCHKMKLRTDPHRVTATFNLWTSEDKEVEPTEGNGLDRDPLALGQWTEGEGKHNEICEEEVRDITHEETGHLEIPMHTKTLVTVKY